MIIKKIFISVSISALIFFSLTNIVQASIFDNDSKENKSEIEETIDKDEGGLFEKVIAKMIGGLAETVFDLSTSKVFGIRI